MCCENINMLGKREICCEKGNMLREGCWENRNGLGEGKYVRRREISYEKGNML